MVMLPYRAQAGLYLFCVFKFSDLLELVNAYHDASVLALGDDFNHIEHFLRRMSFRGYPKGNAYLRNGIYGYPYPRSQTYQEVTGFLHPELYLGGSLF